MDWIKRGSAITVLDAVKERSGMTEDELLHPQNIDPNDIENLQATAALILDAASCSRPVAVFGDYDVDGITATSILCRLFRFFGIETTHRLPKRFSEGYGMSTAAIDEIKNPSTLLVTVDNGIAAIDEIAYAKAKGYTVIVMDHHLPGEVLPAADIIVDPHIHPARNGYVDYCGAGLALKLAEYMFSEVSDSTPVMAGNIKKALNKLTLLAAIGTVADVVPLTGDNRRIVKQGLQLLQDVDVAGLTGLRAIIEEAEIYSRTEHEIAYKIGPILNAPGRLLDDGANDSFHLLMIDEEYPGDLTLAKQAAHNLILINEDRKDAVAQAMSEAMDFIEDECLFGCIPLCVCLQNATEGVVGIVAGRLAESMKVPVFVFTASDTPGVLKGSGRTYGNVNLKKMVDSAAQYAIAAGGHEGAAGITVESGHLYDLTSSMASYAAGISIGEENAHYYDLEISPDAVVKSCHELLKYAPFGSGCPSPVFKISDIGLVPRLGNQYKTMGKDGVHLKLFGNGFSILQFNGTEAYRKLGMPMRINVIGNLSENQFRNVREVQLEAADMSSAMAGRSSSKLLDALRKNGTI